MRRGFSERPFLRVVLAGAALLWLAAVPAVAVDVAILSPTADTIVYGPTPVEVEGPPARLYRVYRKQITEGEGTLICQQVGPPRGDACVFDAGKDMSTESLLVEVIGRDGSVIGSATVDTYFFQEPEARVAARANPLIETGIVGEEEKIEALIADPALIECRLGGRACRVASIEPRLGEGTLRITLLIDESGSVGRAGLAKVVPAIKEFVGAVDTATQGGLAVEYEVIFFSEYMRNATHGYTDDLDEVGRAIASAAPTGGTCLFGATASTLRNIQNRRLLDRYASRKRSYALIIWSDGQNMCPGRYHTADLAVEEAYWSESPVFVVPLKISPPCRFGCSADPEFLELGRLSGGETYGEFDELSELLTNEIFEQLMSTYVLEIEPEDLKILERARVLELNGGDGIELRHRGLVSPGPPRRKLAMRILEDDLGDIVAKAGAADMLSKEPGRVRARVAQAIYGELREAIRDLTKDLESRARELGHERLADSLRSRRRSSGSFLTRKELSIVKLLEPDDSRAFMAARNTIIESIITLTGRALLWRRDRGTHRDLLGLLAEMREQGYRLLHSESRLPIYLRAFTDPDFPADPELKSEASAMLEQEDTAGETDAGDGPASWPAQPPSTSR